MTRFDAGRQPYLALTARLLLVDCLTAEVVRALARESIDCMLLKGPVIGEWLYPDAIRPYGDSDLLVPAVDWERALEVLRACGFRDYLGSLEHPRVDSAVSKPFIRGADNVDMHRSIDGLEAAPEEVWKALWGDALPQRVGGESVPVPARPAILMHIALHAAHHHSAQKPAEDLRRGIAAASLELWREAAELADRLRGLPAFASGLRRLPQGQSLARALGVESAGSVHFDLRAAGVPTAEGLHDLLQPGLTPRQRGSLVLQELFPKPTFMQWWMPIARRGPIGLLASYPIRWAWLAIKVPAGFLVLRRAQRSRR